MYASVAIALDLNQCRRQAAFKPNSLKLLPKRRAGRADAPSCRSSWRWRRSQPGMAQRGCAGYRHNRSRGWTGVSRSDWRPARVNFRHSPGANFACRRANGTASGHAVSC